MVNINAGSAWATFKNKPAPLAKVREIHAALQQASGKGNVPGLNVLFREARESGTVLGVPVLKLGARLYVPRDCIVRKVEGR